MRVFVCAIKYLLLAQSFHRLIENIQIKQSISKCNTDSSKNLKKTRPIKYFLNEEAFFLSTGL